MKKPVSLPCFINASAASLPLSTTTVGSFTQSPARLLLPAIGVVSERPQEGLLNVSAYSTIKSSRLTLIDWLLTEHFECVCCFVEFTFCHCCFSFIVCCFRMAVVQDRDRLSQRDISNLKSPA